MRYHRHDKNMSIARQRQVQQCIQLHLRMSFTVRRYQNARDDFTVYRLCARRTNFIFYRGYHDSTTFFRDKKSRRIETLISHSVT